MKSFIGAVIVAVGMSLAACSTTYGPKDSSGQGVDAAAITSDTYRISALGSGVTDPNTIQDFALLKAAETTLAAGHTHFVVVSAQDASRHSTYRSAGTINSNVYGSSVFTTYNPGQTYNIVQPGQDLMIRVFTPKSNTQLPPGTFPAQEVFDAINPRVERRK